MSLLELFFIFLYCIWSKKILFRYFDNADEVTKYFDLFKQNIDISILLVLKQSCVYVLPLLFKIIFFAKKLIEKANNIFIERESLFKTLHFRNYR